MEYKSILVPFDGSDSSRNALATAHGWAASTPDAKVTVLYVAAVPDFDSTPFILAEEMSGMGRASEARFDAMRASYLAFQRAKLESMVSKQFGSADGFNLVVEQGKPSKVIAGYARAHDVDVIVMGSRGLDAVRGTLGSVSYAVLRNVECPVLIER